MDNDFDNTEFMLDEYGRLILTDHTLLTKISGALLINELPHEQLMPLDGGCSNTACGANAGCSNAGCGN